MPILLVTGAGPIGRAWPDLWAEQPRCCLALRRMGRPIAQYGARMLAPSSRPDPPLRTRWALCGDRIAPDRALRKGRTGDHSHSRIAGC